ncbi:SDR family NAD(P)-dependent oxidoreductase [Sphingosinicella xenopeptidilytica]|uniref:SDR family NAD(P)-dependent oxidoreductase n=1 Tax=Sphingosinicella xenopeptidilytica TaxID=364098 RepID=A0ABW3C6Z6_SPHXN
MGQLSGKVALVTGAGQGLGEAIAALFAAEGATVVLSDLTTQRCESGVEAIRKQGGKAVAYGLDVTSETQWNDTIALIEKEYGRLDVLVNNAGMSFSASIEDTSFENWKLMQAVNLDSVFLGCKAGISLMKRTGGSIVNLSSVWGLVGQGEMTAYNASKAGVWLLTKSVAIHCGAKRYNIRVNSIHPGFIETPMLWNFLDNSGDPEGMRKAAVDLHPIGNLGTPDDIAQGALYLASDASKFVTGTELVIDGGYTAW